LRVRYAVLAFGATAIALTVVGIWVEFRIEQGPCLIAESVPWMSLPPARTVHWINRVPEIGKARDTPVRLQFVDSAVGWLSIGKKLWKTEDEGKHWRLVYRTHSDGIRQLKFIDKRTGWLLTATRLYRSSDGGLSWAALPQPIHSDADGWL